MYDKSVTSPPRFALPSQTTKIDLFVVSALFLFLELVFIRWLPAHVLFLTFFTNAVLLSSFLGLSLGCMAARSRKSYLPLTPLFLVICVIGGAGMEWLRLALQDVIDVGANKTSPQMVYFGAETRVSDVARFVIPIEVVLGIFFVLIAFAMIGLGQVLGRRFARFEHSQILAYSINIAGSLAGILLFQLCSSALSPIWWFTIVSAGLLYFLLQETNKRFLVAVFCFLAPAVLVALEVFPVGVIREKFPVESWSPYYRINYSPSEKAIAVNLLGHQQMVSRKESFPAYALPYLLNRDSGQPAFKDILIIGAGSGNDVSRALQWAAPDARIDAVEIDPVIQRLGAENHPDRPYQDARVTKHLGDGRNFLRSTSKKYDLIVFALIDSLVLHSSVSNIRLESYLFTRESIADVRRCLKPDGAFAMYNYFRQGWIVSRLVWTVENVFNQQPLVLTMPEQERIAADAVANGFTVLFAGSRANEIARAFDNGPYRLEADVPPTPASPNGFQVSPPAGKSLRFVPAIVEVPADLRIAEDTWPFLYLRNPMIPELSWRGMAMMALVSFVLLWMFGWRLSGEYQSNLNGAMLLLGAGFMLLETKAVVHMALVFGSTWTVNTVVFSAIMVMILLANLWVTRKNPSDFRPYYAGLIFLLTLNFAIPLDSLLGLPPIVQAIVAGSLVLSPVACAGVIFAMLIRTAEKPEQAIAYNTAGAIIGGLTESISLLIGFKYLLIVACFIYMGAWVFGNRQPQRSIAELQTV